MLSRLRRIGEPYRMLLIGLATFAVFWMGRVWPSLEYALWGAFAVTVAALLYADLRDPVNYESLQVVEDIIEYVAAGQKHVIRLPEVTKLEFVREEALFPDLTGPYLETKWMIRCGDSDSIEVMDEWPHRKRLVKTFKRHLSGFDEEAAQSGIKARSAGRWPCYARSVGAHEAGIRE